MKKTIECGKIDWYGKGRKINAVTLEVELKDTDMGPVFSMCGNVWNSKRTDIVAGGQCIDELAEFEPFAEGGKYAELVGLWRRHHLNDMHSGTERQEAVLEKWQKEHPDVRRTYDVDCKVLKDAQCYKDGGYVYGTAWLNRPIPDADLAKIRKWLGE